MPTYEAIAKWLNGNQGVLSLGIFGATLVLGWASGIFSSLRQRPKFKLNLIEGPTFSCSFEIGQQHGNYSVHRTAFALYVRVANVGSAASSIERISIGYRCHFAPFTRLWVKYNLFGRLWLKDQIAAIHDFQVAIGENIKFFPFLTQTSTASGRTANTFLLPGQATSGVMYFEQPDSWGGFLPTQKNSKVHIKISVEDTFGSVHKRTFWIKAVTLEEARVFNPSFGKTLAELRGETLPHDASA